jgi:hypothetical protein
MVRRARLRRFGLTTLLVGMLLMLMAAAGVQAHGTSITAIPRGDVWKYNVVAHGAEAGFEAVTFDDSSWATGQAGFGTPGTCAWITTSTVNTSWPINTDILVRKEITLPAGAHNLRVQGDIDNNATVYVNGVQIGQAIGGFCVQGLINFPAPDALLQAGSNIIAIRGDDRGVVNFLDVTVTYDEPVYTVCVLYDESKAHKSGSTAPIKLQLCDEDGNNISSADYTLNATSVKKVDNSTTGVVEDSGNANPDQNFRYSADVGEGGGYIFNKSLKGFTSGTWVLSFTVNGGETHYTVQFGVK